MAKEYKKVSMYKATFDKLHELNKRVAPRVPFVEFIDEVVSDYENHFCHECGNKLQNLSCSNCTLPNF